MSPKLVGVLSIAIVMGLVGYYFFDQNSKKSEAAAATSTQTQQQQQPQPPADPYQNFSAPSKQ